MMQPTIFSLGYSGVNATDMARWCQAWDTVVLDTRIKPWSRDASWRMSALSDLLGSRYLWLRDFGNRRYQETDPDAIDLVNPKRGVRIASRMLRSGSILLLCMCPHWESCHRREVASLIHDATGAPIHHLGAADLSPRERLL
jgi:hypothetical protein